MRWKETLWLSIALAMAVCAQHITIDKDINKQEQDINPVTTEDTDNTYELETSEELELPESNSHSAGESGSTQETDSNESVPNSDPKISDEDIETLESDEENGPTGDNGNIDPSIEEESESSTGDNSSQNAGDRSEPVAPSSESESVTSDEDEVISTEHGKVRGSIRLLDDISIASYIDIPYGALTGLFTPPTQPRAWTGIHEVAEHNKRCPQLRDDRIYVGSLDCLTLSVFAPQHATGAKVLFHIHDGNFLTGSGDPSIYGPEHLIEKGIILVLPNYRLGPFGFLCLRNEIAPGNAALKDLTLALNWTKHNIERFGGDPSSITVSGDGSSGALVGYLALSAKSKDYFTRAITESGSVLSHWAIDRDPIATARKVAKAVNAASTVAPNTISRTDLQRIANSANNVRFKPCIENDNDTNAFMTESPWAILQHNETEIKIDFIMGSANHAGMHEALDHGGDSLSQLNEDFSLFLPNDLHFSRSAEKVEVGERVKKECFQESNVNVENVEKLSLCYTDASYLGPVLRAARSLVKCGAKVFLYEFNFVGEFNREHNALTNPVKGAARGDLVGYVFTQDEKVPVPDTDEDRVLTWVTDLWASFIKTGIPLTTDEDENVNWQELLKVEDEQESWLAIGSALTSETGLHKERMRLWSEIYDKHFIEHNLALALQTCLFPVLLAVTVTFGF